MSTANSAGSESVPDAVSDSALPEVQIQRQRWPSPVWLIPLAALLIGVWLLVQHWYSKGEKIAVSFASAEGIQPGTTEVRYKAVTVGKVSKVTLDEELNPVVTLVLNKEISNVLDCSAQFWVVRPRIRGAEISGLGTIFSGTYVEMLPFNQEGGTPSRDSLLCYQALDEPPPLKPNRPGRNFVLEADSMGSVDIGTPIFYKQLKVGEVTNFSLAETTGTVELDIFVEDPYFLFVNKGTRFWNASGAEFKMDSSGAEFRMESLTSLLIGGIAFETQRVDSSMVSAEGERFTLFESYQESREKRFKDRLYYTLYFDGSVRGLALEAPVEFQGIKIGQVENISMNVDTETLDVRTPVLVSIEPQRLSEDILFTDAPDIMAKLVEKGLRAQLQSGNLLTGQMYVALTLEDDAEVAAIEQQQFYAVFPTSTTPVQELSQMGMDIAADLKKTLAKIREFVESDQISTTVDNVNKVLTSADKAVTDARSLIQNLDKRAVPGVLKNVDSISKDFSRITQSVDSVGKGVDQGIGSVTSDVNRVSNELNKTMVRLQGTLTHLDRMLARNSPTQHQLHEMLEEVTAASRSLKRLTDSLERQPDSLLRGKKEF